MGKNSILCKCNIDCVSCPQKWQLMSGSIWCVLYLQAYHSQFTSPPQVVGNMALLPLRTQFKGPAAKDSQSALLICLLCVVKQFYCVNFFTAFSATVLVFVTSTQDCAYFKRKSVTPQILVLYLIESDVPDSGPHTPARWILLFKNLWIS